MLTHVVEEEGKVCSAPKIKHMQLAKRSKPCNEGGMETKSSSWECGECKFKPQEHEDM
jgi:hypothetical protein